MLFIIIIIFFFFFFLLSTLASEVLVCSSGIHSSAFTLGSSAS